MSESKTKDRQAKKQFLEKLVEYDGKNLMTQILNTHDLRLRFPVTLTAPDGTKFTTTAIQLIREGDKLIPADGLDI